ncbi:MAG: energy transducer TonB [Thiovulaceae bacterium]|nr:energy transducer TonB [Sulfurimonadaceae bacterium]
MNILRSIVVSKNIYSDDKHLKFKSFLLSLALHCTFFIAVWNIEPTKMNKPILLDAQEKTIHISLANIAPLTTVSQKTVSKKKSLIEKPKHQIHTKEIVQKTPRVVQTVQTRTPQKSEPQVTSVPSSEAFAPQQPSKTEHDINVPNMEASFSKVMNSPSLSKAPPKKAQQNDIGKEQLAHIRTMIENALCYPAIAKKLRLEGVVTVSFSLRSNGNVENIQIVSSSGSSVLDKKALQTVASLDGEYPHLEKKVDLSLPISFSLHKS